MTKTDPFESVVAEAPPGVKPAHVAAKKAAKLELDGDEIIQFTIRPSLWYIPLLSLKWLLVIGLAGTALAIAMRTGSPPAVAAPFQILVGLAMLAVLTATLQWASRLYVLTNRRVIRFKGIYSVDVAECPLAKISAADLRIGPHQRLLRLGSIHMTPSISDLRGVVWEDVAHPTEIHERLLRAIHKSQSRR